MASQWSGDYLMRKQRYPFAESVVLAGRQGFDDGYFRNDEERGEFETEAERVAYDTEFAAGRLQRKAADKIAAKKAKR
jgi:hypothetical protein